MFRRDSPSPSLTSILYDVQPLPRLTRSNAVCIAIPVVCVSLRRTVLTMPPESSSTCSGGFLVAMWFN